MRNFENFQELLSQAHENWDWKAIRKSFFFGNSFRFHSAVRRKIEGNFLECNSCSSSIIKVCLQFKCNFHWTLHSPSTFSKFKMFYNKFFSRCWISSSSLGCCLLLLKTSLEKYSSSSLWIKGNKLRGKELSEWTCLSITVECEEGTQTIKICKLFCTFANNL